MAKIRQDYAKNRNRPTLTDLQALLLIVAILVGTAAIFIL
jgi:hypothetical protein